MVKMPQNQARNIQKKVDEIAADPYRQRKNVTALQGRDGYRLRVGDNRVIYKLYDGELVLLVVKVGRRGGIYK
jgi:mRNA interferase RelE/StbE